MGDRTLVEGEIERFAADIQLIEPFSPAQLRQCFYDLRVGSKIIYPHPDGYIHVQMARERNFTLRPGDICTVYSLEKVNMPLNVKGRLSLRGRLANQQILYGGGPVSPGYRGFLFFTLINMGGAPVTICYADSIVTAEFILLETAVREAYSSEMYLEIPEYRLPSLPERKLYDWAEVSQKIEAFGSRHERIEREVRFTHILAVIFFYALMVTVIGGALAGLVILVFQNARVVSALKSVVGF